MQPHSSNNQKDCRIKRDNSTSTFGILYSGRDIRVNSMYSNSEGYGVSKIKLLRKAEILLCF